MKTDKKDILSELLLSEKRDNVLSIKVKGIEKPLITAVEKVLHNRIILKPTCIYGYPLQRTVITLLEIEGIKRYNFIFSSPVYERIRSIKDSITKMRENIESIKVRQTVY